MLVMQTIYGENGPFFFILLFLPPKGSAGQAQKRGSQDISIAIREERKTPLFCVMCLVNWYGREEDANVPFLVISVP